LPVRNSGVVPKHRDCRADRLQQALDGRTHRGVIVDDEYRGAGLRSSFMSLDVVGSVR